MFFGILKNRSGSCGCWIKKKNCVRCNRVTAFDLNLDQDFQLLNF